MISVRPDRCGAPPGPAARSKDYIVIGGYNTDGSIISRASGDREGVLDDSLNRTRDPGKPKYRNKRMDVIQ